MMFAELWEEKDYYTCSSCHASFPKIESPYNTAKDFNYCPMCGAMILSHEEFLKTEEVLDAQWK